MNRGSRIQIFIVALVGGVLALQMTTTSAATIANAGQACKKIGLTGVTKASQPLICAKSGKKLLWKVDYVPTKRIPTQKFTQTPTPSATASESPSIQLMTTPTPTPSETKAAGLISADCVALIVKVGAQDVSAGMPSGSDGLSTCLKDSGVTEVITSSPFNPADIASITKFRSCAGHDYAEGSNDGKVVSQDPQYEKFSSMKHYIGTLKQNTNDRINVFAPFDGFVSKVTVESGGAGGTFANPGSQINLIPYANPAITFTYFHVYGLSVKVGDAVTAGQKIAYNEVQSVNVGHSSFDIAMSKFDMAAMLAKASRKLSMMNYLSPTVASIFAKAGLTPENSIWSAAYRTANPCIFTGSLGFFQGPENPADRVTLKH